MPVLYSSIAQSVEHAAVNRRVVGSSPTWGVIVGADYAEEPPVPIPNTEVKLSSAEDTWRETAWENRWVPIRRKKLLQNNL